MSLPTPDDAPIVLIAHDGSKSLLDYCHEDNTWYVQGPGERSHVLAKYTEGDLAEMLHHKEFGSGGRWVSWASIERQADYAGNSANDA